MAIRVHLDQILLERRMSLTELADRVGVTLANLSILKTGKARAIRFSTLEALCRELQCQPGDLLTHVPGPLPEAMADPSDDAGAPADTREAEA
ncbi:MAG: helix-turn-helix domain-containing protein [Brevundimonas sp.]|jgi:putative transcriptional regulator|uniref:helix-turn-helix domain-containing protein n=1 Tax=Brevundimonas sp. TaxID=1871086 RepID=UPI00391D98CF